MASRPIRAIGYVRISRADEQKTDEEQRVSLRTQEASIRRYCEDHGWELLVVHEDFAKTGANEDRSGYTAALSLLNGGKADRLVVVRLDRISREADVLLGLMKKGRYKWSIAATEQSIDTSSAGGWLAAAMFAVIAEHERLQLGERTASVLAHKKREKGIVPGPKSSVPTQVDDYIARLHSKGLSASAIARRLDEDGIPRPGSAKTWHHKQVLAAVQRVGLRALQQSTT